jgi:hypothetical protein
MEFGVNLEIGVDRLISMPGLGSREAVARLREFASCFGVRS